MVQVMLINPDLTMEVRSIKGELSDYQEMVGGYIEAISGVYQGKVGWSAFLHDEGKFIGLRHNLRAELTARALGWLGDPSDRVVGPVVFTGPPDSDGETTDVPLDVIRMAMQVMD